MRDTDLCNSWNFRVSIIGNYKVIQENQAIDVCIKYHLLSDLWVLYENYEYLLEALTIVPFVVVVLYIIN